MPTASCCRHPSAVIGLVVVLTSAFALHAHAAAPRTPSPQSACALQVFEDPTTGLFGYRDASGALAVPAQFRWAEPFGRKALALVDRGWLSCTGAMYAPFLFDAAADPFERGPVRFVVGDGERLRFGFLGADGREVLPAQFGEASFMCHGYARVGEDCTQRSDGEHLSISCTRYRYVDRRGWPAVPPKGWSDDDCREHSPSNNPWVEHLDRE